MSLFLSEYKYLYELVNILIDNAVKYCDDKGLVEVKLSQSKKNSNFICNQ